jgi:hypothetical protein
MTKKSVQLPVLLTEEQSSWLRDTAKHLGWSLGCVVRYLIDDERKGTGKVLKALLGRRK